MTAMTGIVVPSKSEETYRAARCLYKAMAAGSPIVSGDLREIMVEAFGGSDSAGKWQWKDAYDAVEMAAILYIREQKFGSSAPHEILHAIESLALQFPTHSVRSIECQDFQQFSTPLPLGYVVSVAGAIGAGDIVLEPSAGTGILAVFAELGGASLVPGRTHANLY